MSRSTLYSIPKSNLYTRLRRSGPGANPINLTYHHLNQLWNILKWSYYRISLWGTWNQSKRHSRHSGLSRHCTSSLYWFFSFSRISSYKIAPVKLPFANSQLHVAYFPCISILSKFFCKLDSKDFLSFQFFCDLKLKTKYFFTEQCPCFSIDMKPEIIKPLWPYTGKYGTVLTAH